MVIVACLLGNISWLPGQAPYVHVVSKEMGLGRSHISRIIEDHQGVVGSDAGLKSDIRPIGGILPQVLQLEPKTYQYRHNPDGPKAYGFIAQEVEGIFPEFVNEREDGFKGIAYDNFSVVAIQAIKEQQEIINQQQALITELLQRVENLEKQ